MANIYGRSTATFNPYSFEEMLKPALMATEAHNKLADEYANLEVMAEDVASKLSNNPKDESLKSLYNQFKTKLQEVSNTFSTQGLSATTRKDLAKLKAQYAKDINPINEAYKRYMEDQQYISKLALTNPNLIVEGVGTSISDYMMGTPNKKSVNLDNVVKSATQMGAAASQRTFRSDGWKPDLGGKLLTNVEKIGFTEQEFNKALNDYISGNIKDNFNAQLIGNIYNTALTEAGYDNFKDPTNKTRIRNAVIEGMRSGFAYKQNSKSMQNPDYKPPKDNNDGNGDDNKGNPNSIINTMTLGSIDVDKKLGKKAEKGLDFTSNIRKLTNKDGSTTLTTDEIEIVKQQIENKTNELININPNSAYGHITGKQKASLIQRQLNQLNARLESLTKTFGDKYIKYNDQYSYLNTGDDLNNINVGLAYDDARSKEEIFIADLAKDPTQEAKLDKAVIKSFIGLSDKGNVGIFDEESKKALSNDKANKILEDENTHVIVVSDKGIVLKTADGIKELKGDDKIDAFNTNYKNTTQFLKDYSKEGLNNSKQIYQNEAENLTLNDIITNMEEFINQGILSVVSKEQGDLYLGMTVRLNNGDIQKVLIHPSSNYMITSSLYDIVNNGGASIRDYQEVMLARGLSHYFDINTQK